MQFLELVAHHCPSFCAAGQWLCALKACNQEHKRNQSFSPQHHVPGQPVISVQKDEQHGLNRTLSLCIDGASSAKPALFKILVFGALATSTFLGTLVTFVDWLAREVFFDKMGRQGGEAPSCPFPHDQIIL